MRYGLASEAKAIEKYERAFNVKVRRCGLWVNPKFPFLGCSPDGLVDDDTVVEIKALKLLKEYSVEQITSATSVVPKHVLKRQCFVVKDGKCVLQRSHSYYYQCQHILLVTERKSCVFILYAESGPDSVEKITRDEALITKILEYIQALWMRVIAPEIFEMRTPRDLLPFILPESPSSEPVTHCDTGTPASLPASWSFEKAYTPIYQTFRMFSLHIDAPSHTFSYGGLQCLSESRGGSHETKSIFRICARRYYVNVNTEKDGMFFTYVHQLCLAQVSSHVVMIKFGNRNNANYKNLLLDASGNPKGM